MSTSRLGNVAVVMMASYSHHCLHTSFVVVMKDFRNTKEICEFYCENEISEVPVFKSCSNLMFWQCRVVEGVLGIHHIFCKFSVVSPVF